MGFLCKAAQEAELSLPSTAVCVMILSSVNSGTCSHLFTGIATQNLCIFSFSGALFTVGQVNFSGMHTGTVQSAARCAATEQKRSPPLFSFRFRHKQVARRQVESLKRSQTRPSCNISSVFWLKTKFSARLVKRFTFCEKITEPQQWNIVCLVCTAGKPGSVRAGCLNNNKSQ